MLYVLPDTGHRYIEKGHGTFLNALSFYNSSAGNRREVPPLDAAQRRADRSVDQTRPRPEDIRASREGSAEEPLSGALRRFLLTSYRSKD